jgi:5-formyltetrahydrofolate cyclo-ligase
MPRRPPDHARDAGGDPELLRAKAALRQEVWQAIEAAGAARFPGAAGRIPNFIGAEAAAERLRETEAFARAGTVKANPDSPQLPARQRVIEEGKTLYMAVPRLQADKPFLALRAEELPVRPRQAASIKGAGTYGRPAAVEEMDPFDLVVTGCVAVSPSGARLGKGGGYSDLEYGILGEAGLVGPDTVVVTTVHDVQVVEDERIPVTDHDFGLDLIVTPTRVIDCSVRRRPHPGVRWDELTEEKIAAIPLLGQLQQRTAR